MVFNNFMHVPKFRLPKLDLFEQRTASVSDNIDYVYRTYSVTPEPL
jgi:hypothetical protein